MSSQVEEGRRAVGSARGVPWHQNTRMSAASPWLFWTPTLIWASTWHVILYQLAESSPFAGVVWRFSLAATLLAGLAVLRKKSLAIAPHLHPRMMLTGALQYGLNYTCVYEAEKHIPSGLVAVLFTLMVFINAFTGAIFFQRALTARFLLAALGGVAGVAIIFWPELVAAGARPQAGWGLTVGVLAVLSACAGNVFTLKLSERGVSLIPLLAWCMGYGALTLVVVATLGGQSLMPGHSVVWWSALLYLAAFGSVLAFFTYFRLAQARGPGRAALTSVVIPVIALMISGLLEGWRPHALSLAGVVVCLASVWWATRPTAAPAVAEGRAAAPPR